MRAAIFDMDGLLIDSEPLWRQAEQEIFGRLDILLSDAQCAETTGLRVDEVVAYRFEREPWSACSQEAVAADILRRVTELVIWGGEPLPGALETVQRLANDGLVLGLASSSPPVLIDATLERLGIRDSFAAIHSAIEEARGKPDPAVYLTTAERLSVPVGECVAFEDSIAGVQAAAAAGMTVVAVPSEADFHRPELADADLKVRSLVDFSLNWLVS